jgi:hypothetical protein
MAANFCIRLNLDNRTDHRIVSDFTAIEVYKTPNLAPVANVTVLQNGKLGYVGAHPNLAIFNCLGLVRRFGGHCNMYPSQD